MAQIYVTEEQMQLLLEERREALQQQVTLMIATAIEPLKEELQAVKAELQNVVKLGAKVSLKAANGQFICTEDGGPKVERQPFNLTSRATNGVWESLEVVKGQ